MSRKSREISSRCCRTLLGPGILLLFIFSALGNPTGGTVTQGSATISSSGSTLNVNQTSADASITWSTFNIGAGETVNFNQPTSESVTFNQINDVNPSQILGDINANGYVILENANGFYVGGQAVLNVHGLIMTTATATVNFSDGGPWSFDAPPPTAEIQNYGQINITGGGTAYLIAADIVNNGAINAPNGHIGLYDGETVLVSTSPNGEGLSAQVTLPEGSVDNEGNLTANGGSVVAQAQFVNQNGMIQATTAENVDGTIELLGGSSVTLGANSTISATGNSTATSASAGGSVEIQAGTSFSDASGSSINVSGAAQGGNAGQISISAPQMSALNSTLNGQAAAGYLNGALSIDTADIALNSDGSPVSGALSLDVNALSSGFSQINLQASDDITLGAQWLLAPNGGIPTDVSLQAGNEIALASGSEIQANGGNITLNAPTVDQVGTLQANSIGDANGVIDIDASQDLILGGSSVIDANGDSSAATASPGGFVVLNAGNAYSDASGSTISVSGNVAGGQGGIVEIFDPQAGSTPVQSAVSGAFAYLVNPFDVTLSDNANGTSYDANNNLDANFNLNSLAAYSQIDLQALDDIELSAAWKLNNASIPSVVSLTAGNDIIVDDADDILAGDDWSLNLTAGTGFVPTAGQPAPASGSDGIYLDGSAFIESENGDINLWAANEVQVGWSGSSAGVGIVNTGTGSIFTDDGGSINVSTLYGDVNTGSGTGGFIYTSKAPYYKLEALGGISTADGGNVTITAGGNVISYTPTSEDINQDGINGDPGTGAFGTAPGNVTITAGGSVYGNYVLANGVGDITSENGNVGTATGLQQFALSLIDGSWNVNAPNGNIFLTEVRNPNADYNEAAPSLGQSASSETWQNLFTYGADDAVDLTAGDGVFLGVGGAPPRLTSDPVPVVYPSILDITAGAGGVTLEGDVTLFPSVDQNLEIVTTDGGNFTSTSENNYLMMSDSSHTQWESFGDSSSFSLSDYGDVLPTEFQPVIIDISGDMGGPDFTDPGVDLITTKETDVTVGGDMINCEFSGQNLSVNDVTSINVAGQIYNASAYSFVNGVEIPSIPADDIPDVTIEGLQASWEDIFALAINPAELSKVIIPADTPPSEVLGYILEQASLFGDVTVANNGTTLEVSAPDFVYNSTTGQLGFGGQMSAQLEQELASGTLTVLRLVNGEPVLNSAGQYETVTVSWAPASDIAALFSESQGAPSPNSPLSGYRVGGPGQFDVTAGTISLGDSDGILSCGASDLGSDAYDALASLTPSGATINVTVTGPDTSDEAALSMVTSAIAALGGGDVNVTCTEGSMDLGLQELANSTASSGIYTAYGGDVNVIALGDIDIDGSRIATYDGGNIFVESLTGDVNVGSGGDSVNDVYVSYVNPTTGQAADYTEETYGGGIIANTLVPAFPGGLPWPPDVATVPGNITVETPEGSIISSAAGIIQEALNGTVTAGPTVTLTAGTFPSADSPGYAGNIDLGDSGVIGGTVNLSANGNIIGQVVSRQNSVVNAAEGFSGTLLSGGSAQVTGGGTISGTIIGIGGVSVSGGGGVTASLLGQNVSVNGGASQDTLGSSATATSATQSAAQQASSQSQQQVATDTTQEEDDKKKKPKVQKVGRVTVILSAAVPK